jgi:AhpD family alkylhydroperoxidase
MSARIPNPAVTIPGAMQALLAVGAAARKTGVPEKTLHLVFLRASQINGCSVCCEMHARDARKGGETDDRLFTVAAWRDTPYFTPAERAALALTEATTRVADCADPVPDEVWAEAAKHYDDAALAGLVLNIALINLWNRTNIPTRQPAGQSWK